MTFPAHFQQCQTLITKEINLPFDAPFPQEWTYKYSAEFEMLYKDGLTPYKSVKVHFADIDSRALQLKKVKTTKIK